MSTKSMPKEVALTSDTPIKDDRLESIQSKFAEKFREESAYSKLDTAKKEACEQILLQLSSMKFEALNSYQYVAELLLSGIGPELKNYVSIAIANAQAALPNVQGVLVIYCGGTIGSAPKDPEDSKSPQVVKPWEVLKASFPKLGSLGFPIDAVSFAEPLDSCNVGPEHWRTIAGVIHRYYQDYAGFVILHGTDTMVSTASVLSFMLQNLSKPVVITGAQLAGIASARNDANQNVISSLLLANPAVNKLQTIPESVICFGNWISRGCRSRKVGVDIYQGFNSPNYPLLGEFGDRIELHRKQIRPVPEVDQVEFISEMDTNVILLEVFPGIQHSSVVPNILADENLKGVVLKAYGAGNIPTQPEFLDHFKRFIDRGGIVAVTTAVVSGRVEMGLYETSQLLLDRGMVGCFDITPEAALCKLMVLLGKYGDDRATVKQLMQISLCGEQSLSLLVSSFNKPGKSDESLKAKLPPAPLESTDQIEAIDKVILRLINAKFTIDGDADARASISITVIGAQYPNGDPYVVSTKKGKVPAGALIQDDEVGESLAFDITEIKEAFLAKVSASKIASKQSIGFDLTLESGCTLEWQSAELLIFVRD